MSYILDALKKAERDRLRKNPKELDDFASSNWDPYQQAPKSDLPKYIILLVCFMAALSGLAIYSGLLNPAQAPQQAPAPKVSDQVVEKSAPQLTINEPVVRVAVMQAQPLSMPELQISGHMYMAEGSASNRLFANGGSFRQGDKIDDRWTLLAVGIDGIEISAGERREFLPYR
ncbi:MAG: hypothetical protein P8P26_01725 [Porticoccaceae bacterium]|nr:hypothetical protein [Porticoccaceae bacterium]